MTTRTPRTITTEREAQIEAAAFPPVGRSNSHRMMLCDSIAETSAERAISRALAERAQSLIWQIDKSNAIDDHGHEIKNLHALAELRAALAQYTAQNAQASSGDVGADAGASKGASQ